VIVASRADVSFVVGMGIDKFDYHFPLYCHAPRLGSLRGLKILVATAPFVRSITLVRDVSPPSLCAVRMAQVAAGQLGHANVRFAVCTLSTSMSSCRFAVHSDSWGNEERFYRSTWLPFSVG
jgi:hypothetical protein